MYAEKITHYKRAKSGRTNRQGFKTYLDHVCAHVFWIHVLCDGVSPAVLIPAISHLLT